MTTLNVFVNPIIFQKWKNLNKRCELQRKSMMGLASIVQNTMQIDSSRLRDYKILTAKLARDFDVLKFEMVKLSEETLLHTKEANEGL